MTLGAYPAMALAAARGAAIEARGLVQAGADPRAHKAGTMALAMLVECYLAKHVRPNLRGAAQVERRLHKNVVPVIGNVRLADLHRRDINRAVDAIVARGRLTEATRVFSDLRAMLRWAVARGDLDRNPAEGMEAPAPPRSRDRVLSEAEIAKLWKALPRALPEVDAQRIIKLCLITGQRVGEVSGMQRSELDETARAWSLSGARTKNGHPHTVPLSDMALTVIEEALAASNGPNLFKLPAKDVSRLVAKSLSAFGIPKFVPHDLRRSALTCMAALGVEPIVLGFVANHRTTTKAGITLATYIKHSYEAEKRRALELWADRLAATIAGKPSAAVVPLRDTR
jgi:integrase